MGKLTARQERFCREYIIDLNAAQAAIRAGYSEKTAKNIGCENLTKPDINLRIAQLSEKRSKQTQIDAAWVLQAAKNIYDRCMQAEPVLNSKGEPQLVKTGNGELAAAYKFDSTGANKALDTIGKHIDVQAFLDKREVNAVVEVTHEEWLESLDDDD
jgi:phage terminase small subunit